MRNRIKFIACMGMLGACLGSVPANGQEAVVETADRVAGDTVQSADETPAVRARLNVARELLSDELYDEALEEFLWLFDNMAERAPSLSGVRNSYVVSDMTRLASLHPRALDALRVRQEQLEQTFARDGVTWESLKDWIQYSRMIRDDEAILAWVDRNTGSPDGRATLDRYFYLIDDILVNHQRFEQMRLIRDPVAQAREAFNRVDQLKSPRFAAAFRSEQERQEMLGFLKQSARYEIAGALRDALIMQSPDAADQVVAIATRRDGSSEMADAILQAAISADTTTPVINVLAKRAGSDALKQAVLALTPIGDL